MALPHTDGRRLDVQGVLGRLEENRVHAPLDQRRRLQGVALSHLVEVMLRVTEIDRVDGPMAPIDEARPLGARMAASRLDASRPAASAIS